MNLLITAAKYYGTTETPGPLSDPLILGWIRKHFPWAKDDGDIAWCSIFMHQVVSEAGYEIPPLVTPMALSWKHFGVEVPFEEVQAGDIVTMWRNSPTSGSGHVTLWVNSAGMRFRGLGGNQSNGVNISMYDVGRIRNIRRPIR